MGFSFGCLRLLNGGMRTRRCSLRPKLRGTPDKIRGCTARAGENTQKNMCDEGFLEAPPPEDYGSNELVKASNTPKQTSPPGCQCGLATRQTGWEVYGYLWSTGLTLLQRCNSITIPNSPTIRGRIIYQEIESSIY